MIDSEDHQGVDAMIAKRPSRAREATMWGLLLVAAFGLGAVYLVIVASVAVAP
jgi:hypothetical protein